MNRRSRLTTLGACRDTAPAHLEHKDGKEEDRHTENEKS